MNTRITRDGAPQFALTKVFSAHLTLKTAGHVLLPPRRRLYFRPSRSCSALPALHHDRLKFFAAMGRAANWAFFMHGQNLAGRFSSR